MRIAALVKQIPAFTELQLGADGRLQRDGVELEMNPYCRRAVAQAVELAAAVGDGSVTVFTLGPPAAEAVLREAIAWGEQNAVIINGVLISETAFAGSDTLATARALAAALARSGPFDLILTGLNSVDSDTGQVGPEIAELMDLPFATGVRYLSVKGSTLHLRCEHDDGWAQLRIEMPALISCAERLIDPCKVDETRGAQVAPELIKTIGTAELGPGPWGAAASPTGVGEIRAHIVAREKIIGVGTIDEQVAQIIKLLERRDALGRADASTASLSPVVPDRVAASEQGPIIGVLVEPDRQELTHELLGAAAGLAQKLADSELAGLELAGLVVALNFDTTHRTSDHRTSDHRTSDLGAAGADSIINFTYPEPPTHLLNAVATTGIVEQDIGRVVAEWAQTFTPWAILAPSTAWGREITGRSAARLGAGLTSDAVMLEVDDGRLVAWKPAFGGQLVAAITATSPIQMATVRSGMLGPWTPRSSTPTVTNQIVAPESRVQVLTRTRNDDLNLLADATTVVGVGMGVDPDDYPLLDPLLTLLNAPLAATRKVTDAGWLPRSRQVGITGRSIAPRLFIAIGSSGKFNHAVGIGQAGTVVAINSDPAAPIFAAADIGVVGDWREVLPRLTDQLTLILQPDS